jgi:coproporphyrinogen III oxidase-like Fe-S oxidoreductase
MCAMYQAGLATKIKFSVAKGKKGFDEALLVHPVYDHCRLYIHVPFNIRKKLYCVCAVVRGL